MIGNDGQIRFLTHDATSPILKGGRTRRASWIVPKRISLRIAFYLIRFLFGDNGRMAAFTRGWSCNWMVDLRVSRGPVVTGFSCRKAAVEFEERFVLGRLTDG